MNIPECCSLYYDSSHNIFWGYDCRWLRPLRSLFFFSTVLFYGSSWDKFGAADRNNCLWIWLVHERHGDECVVVCSDFFPSMPREFICGEGDQAVSHPALWASLCFALHSTAGLDINTSCRPYWGAEAYFVPSRLIAEPPQTFSHAQQSAISNHYCINLSCFLNGIGLRACPGWLIHITFMQV